MGNTIVQADKEVVMEAVKNDGCSLGYASEELRNDKEVVMEAVKQNGYSLEYASNELKEDKEIVMEAVKKDGKLLKYASEELRNDKEIVWISKKYYKTIESIQIYNLNFKFRSNSKRKFEDI